MCPVKHGIWTYSDALLKAIRRAAPGPVLFLGPVDCGKTALVRQAASALAAAQPVWIVAADAGQSWIGPPTTAARMRLAAPRRRWSGLAAERMIFLGATSPAPCVRQTAAAISALARRDIPAGELVLVDTPGLVEGPLAERMWAAVAGRLRPALVVAIQEGRRLAPILAPFRAAGARILSVRPHPLVRRRNRAARAAYRAAAFRRYFAGARLRWLDLSRVRLEDSEASPRGATAGLARPCLPATPRGSVAAVAPTRVEAGRLVSLRDGAGRDLALAVVRSVRPDRLAVRTPLADAAPVAAVVIGAIRIDPATGREL